MKKVVIKIGKENNKEETPAPADIASKVEVETQQNMVDIVNNWISERRANRLVEKTFSDEIISAWKTDSSF